MLIYMIHGEKEGAVCKQSCVNKQEYGSDALSSPTCIPMKLFENVGGASAGVALDTETLQRACKAMGSAPLGDAA